MKCPPSLLLFAFAASSMAFAGETPAHKPLDYQHCIQTDKINEWYVVDARTALVRTGPDRYLVRTQHDCPRLGVGMPGLLFRANASNKAVGNSRICGEVGESVQARDQPPCAIGSVTMIDKAKFDAMRKHAAHNGSGADQPTH